MPPIARAAQSDELPLLLTLYRHLNPADPPLPQETARSRFDALLAMPDATVFVVQFGDELTASATLFVLPNLTRGGRSYGLIENVITHVGHSRKGYGRLVINAAIEAGGAADCYKVMLLTGRDDPVVAGFYASCGFRQTKTGFEIRAD